MTMKRNLSKLFSFLTLLILLPLSACGDEPFAAPMTIVVFGDSLTAGYRLPADKAFPAQLEARLHAEGYTGIRVINQGISGDNTRGGVARMHTATALQPDIIILELGANDILGRSPASRAEPQLRKLIEAFEQSGALVLLTGIEVPGIFPGA
ncbi:MAG: GDSL-type esterase/lipase family protein, partial [Rickettsiales bacterium]